jgi:hypothetical protein
MQLSASRKTLVTTNKRKRAKILTENIPNLQPILLLLRTSSVKKPWFLFYSLVSLNFFHYIHFKALFFVYFNTFYIERKAETIQTQPAHAQKEEKQEGKTSMYSRSEKMSSFLFKSQPPNARYNRIKFNLVSEQACGRFYA